LRLRLIVLVLAVTGIAGCGSSSSSSTKSATTASATTAASASNGIEAKAPDAILAAARAAADSAQSAHVSGTVPSSTGTITLDLHLLAGKGGQGSMSRSGLTFQVIDVGQTVYISGDKSFWEHFGGAQAAQLLVGKWLKAPGAGGQFAAFASLTDLKKLVDALLTTKSGTPLTKGSITTVNGQQAITLTDPAKGGTAYIAATGAPYPLQITKTANGNSGKIVFDQWNQPVSVSPPSNAIDITQLKGK
jgi:hypothetical protein